MDPLSPLYAKALDDVVRSLKQKVTYLFSYKSYLESLDEKIQKLDDARSMMEHRVEEKGREGEEIEALVKTWLEKVKTIIEKHKQNNADQTNTRCYNGLFPNPWSRYTSGKQAYELAQEVDEELKAMPNIAFVSRQKSIQMESALSTNDYESFDSRKEIVEKVKEKLKDSNVRMIGIYGPGGVGKTTLVKIVAREVQAYKYKVVASVTKNPDRKKIQGEIADALHLRLGEESEIGRAERIRKRLKNETENILIILDDLWVGLDLNELGIPLADCGINHKTTMKAEGMPNLDSSMILEKQKSPADQRMLKILLTSRSRVVLSDQMGVEENSIFSIGLLAENEAETLFKIMAKVTDESSDCKSLVAKIAKKCQGLPIAIETIGKALRGKSLNEWHVVVQELEKKGFTSESLTSESLEFLTKLSFDSLENEELKSVFLHCAQMGNDPLIVDLMKYCYGLSVLQGVHTIKKARDRTLTLIGKLRALSLLSDITSVDHFNMHDMVRDAALSILAEERHVLTIRDEELHEWPNKDELVKFSSISLFNCHISDDLPEDINFPQLKVFHINSEHPFVRIPGNFKGVAKLKVLILTGIPLPHLPFSNESLANGLRMLCLERCLLGDTDNLSIIGKLEKLRILSFSGSHIEELPSDLGQLSKLQLFDISNCSHLRVIPPNVLSRLHSLEELYVRDSPIQWGFEGKPNNEIQNATLAELSYLHQLTNLDVCIPDAAVFPRNLFLDELDSYKIVIGDPELLSEGDFAMPKKYEASRALVLQLKEGINIHTHEGIKMLLRRVEKLLLGELHGVKNVFYELNLEGFQCLKHFCIQNNSDIECVIDSKISSHQDVFPRLELLCLYNLQKLKIICHHELTDFSFSELKSIQIKDCAQLKNIFPISMVRHLKKLETFEVSNCDCLEEIIVLEESTNNNGEHKVEFLQLRSLTLQSLPVFTGFYIDDRGVITSPSLIFSEQVEIPKLETLELSSINNQIQKIWSGQPSPSFCFKNLVKLNVDGCNGLKYLFSFWEAKNLENLRTISVSKCDKMEKIFKSEEINLTEEKVCIFPKLEKINVTSMKRLNEIWYPQEVSLESFPTLSSVFIEECDELVTVFPCHMVGHFPCLEKLEIFRCKSVKEIFDLKDAPQNNEGGNETNLQYVDITMLPNLKHVWNRDPKGILSFKNMQKITVYFCDNLEILFPPSFAKDLENLNELIIFGCPELHEVVWNEGPETSNISFEFPQLTFAAFFDLPKLGSFYRGRHTLEWPLLKNLYVGNCDNLEVLPTKNTNQDNQPILLPEKVMSNLEVMGLSQKEAGRLHQYVDSYLLHRLKELYFYYPFQSNAILYKILHRIPNLRTLSLQRCHMKELLPSGSLVACEEIGIVVQIKDLILDSMFILENIGFEHNPFLHRVESLFLTKCFNLISLAPSTVSFTHLKSLEVSDCDKLLNLMGSSTAKSLVKLTRMKVTKCEAIEEIVATERNEEERVDKDKIVFSKLKTLELVSLKNLTRFCNSKNHNLDFPVLEKLIVRECPKMKTFSEGLTTAPILRQVSLAYAEGDEGKSLWEHDLNAAIRKISTDMVFLKYADSLELSLYPELEREWHGQDSLPDNYFCKLKTLKVANCDFLSIVIPFHLLAYLKNLEELQVSNCILVEVIFDMNDTKMTKTGGKAFSLKKLSLHDLPKLKHVWNKDPQGLINVHKLQDVSVNGCKGLKTLFPKSVAKNLFKLVKLNIRICRALEEIVEKEDAAADGAIEEMFEFPCLANLWLSQLPELKCFYPGRFNLKCPILEDLLVYHCGKLEIFTSASQSHEEAISQDQIISTEAQPLFSIQEVIPILQEVTLNEKDIKMLWRGGVQENLDNLKWLQLQCFHNVNETDHLPYEILQKVPNVETLVVCCSGFKEIFFSQVLEDYRLTMLAQLKRLELRNLPRLNFIGSNHYPTDPILKNLEFLQVDVCPCLTKLIQSPASFSNLKELDIKHCNGLVHLFTSSTAKSLVRLENIRIAECESIKEIVVEERDESDSPEEIMFEQLKELYLDSLLSLASFSFGSSTLKFPYLEKVIIIQCPRMNTFFNGIIEAPMLGAIQVSTQANDLLWAHDLKSTVDKLFNEKVFLKYADSLELSLYPELERVWHGQDSLPDNYFCKLKTLKVTNCDFVSSVISFHLLAYLKNLEELQVSNCILVDVIFDMNDTKMTKTGGKAFSLKKLSLHDLPNLKHVWNKDPQGLINVHKLQDVCVNGCKLLKTLFPISVAKNLLKLVKLDIRFCRALEEIVEKEDAAADGAIEEMFEFPCLANLWLSQLPELKCFYPGRFNLKCPILEDLLVYHCGKLEIFTSASQSHEEAISQDQIISTEAQPLFSIQEVIPMLREVTLNEKDIKMLWRGGFQENLDNLKWLQLQCFHNVNETDHLPYEILVKVPNVETLVVDCGGFQEIFFSQVSEDYHLTMLAQLKKLTLWNLPRLNSIGSKHYSTNLILKNLEVLEFYRCPCLTKLIQSSVSFSNLKELDIEDCNGLVHLFTSSTAKSLVRLEKIRIVKCESIKEIVAEEWDESDSQDEIMFEQLKELYLDSLVSLASFYSGSSTLKFPYLEKVIIIECPRMNTFSNGIIEAPMLGAIQVSTQANDLLWVHDLKSTVDKLFNEKVSFVFIENLKLSNYPELEPLWLGKIPLLENYFSKLKTLMVENCEFLSNVISSNLLPCFKILEELRVRNCSSVEVIFDIKGIETSKIEKQALLLKKLTLDQLPNLKLVWNKNPQNIMSFEKLQKVKVNDCESLQYLFPAASMAKHLLKLKVQNCGALVEILGKEDTVARASETFEFPHLTTVILNYLPELNCFYPGRINLKCPMLKVLNVYHCGKLEMFNLKDKCYQALSKDQVSVSVNATPVFLAEEVILKLKEVSLSEKETMTLWHEELQANFLQNIKCLQLYCFHSITDHQEDILPYEFLLKVPNIEVLAVACSEFKEIFPFRGLKDEYIKILVQLKGIRLEALPKLNSIGLEHSWLVPLNKNIETLEICRCFALTKIVHSAVSFSKLKELNVTKCHKLVYLFTSSTAKSLVQLREMSIEKCELMREIVAKEEEESIEEEIVFRELTKLSLNNLSNLGSFYAGNITLRFPYLQKVIIAQCSKMEVFSEGFISAPQLPAIDASLEKQEPQWEGDLNSTIKKLFKGKEVIIHP